MKALEGELSGVKGELDARAKEQAEAREEGELTLLQLHQVQEKLGVCLCRPSFQQKQLEDEATVVSEGCRAGGREKWEGG